MNRESVQYVDPFVTEAKFYTELGRFKATRKHYRELGVFLLEEAYPKLYFGFAAPGLQPAPIVFAVCLDFTNFDIEPISVRFVHPFTFEPQLYGQMHHNFPRKLEGTNQFQSLLIAELDQQPFICIPGVREYHLHPRHTGDSWFLYRNKNGEGSLCFLLDNLQLYGSSPIRHFNIQMNINAPVLRLLPHIELISK